VAVELHGQLLARDREPNRREGGISMWEDRLAAFKCPHGKVLTECDVGRIRAKAVQQDFFTPSVCLYLQVQTAHQPKSDIVGTLNPSLPEGDGLGGARVDTGREARVWLASHRHAGPVSGTR
jgi:hypothetical protein